MSAHCSMAGEGWKEHEDARHEKEPTLQDELIAFVRDVATNYDHDNDAHRYNTRCRQCEAEKLLERLEKEVPDTKSKSVR